MVNKTAPEYRAILAMQLLDTYDRRESGIAWANEVYGERKPLTAGELMAFLAGVPAETEIKVDHSPAHQSVGHADPHPLKVSPVSTIVDMTERGHPVYRPAGCNYVVFH